MPERIPRRYEPIVTPAARPAALPREEKIDENNDVYPPTAMQSADSTTPVARRPDVASGSVARRPATAISGTGSGAEPAMPRGNATRLAEDRRRRAAGG